MIQGNVSELDGYGGMVIDIDGKECIDIVEETLLTMRNEELSTRIRVSPQAITPSDGRHLYLRFKLKDYSNDDLLKSTKLLSGKNHTEIKLIANGGYSIGVPSLGKTGNYRWEAGRDDFNKIANLTRQELEYFTDCISEVVRRRTKTEKTAFSDEYQKINTEMKDILVSVGKSIYDDGDRHEIVLDFGSIMRRYLMMSKEDVHAVIEDLHPNDRKNRATVEDIFKHPLKKCVSITTFRNKLIQIRDQMTADNIIKTLKDFIPAEEEKELLTGAALLLQLVKDKASLIFKDTENNTYAMVHNEKHDSHDIIDLDSDEFSELLSRLYYEETNGNTLAKRDWKQQVIETLRALITSEPIKLYNRAVWLRDQGIVYYNLSNKKNQILKITKHGGEIIKQSPELIIFKKLPDNYVQVLPDETYNITDKTDYLDKFLDNYNFEDENEKKILKYYIPLLFLDCPPYPINFITANAGCGKGVLSRQIVSLVDPREHGIGDEALSNTLKLDVRETRERLLTIYDKYICCFDNVSKIPKPILDEFCMMVTGFTDEKRTHYKNKEMTKISGKRPIIITAIQNTAPNPDFNDRVMHTRLLKIKTIKTEAQLWDGFYKLKPTLLSFIASKIADFLKRYEEDTDITPKTRMADFEVNAEMMSRCFINGNGEFQNIWLEKRKEIVKDSLENSSFYNVLVNYLKKDRNEKQKELGGKRFGTKPKHIIRIKRTDLYSEFLKDTTYSQTYLSEEDKEGWWQNPTRFGEQINTLLGQLDSVGIEITDDRTTIRGQNLRAIDYRKWAEDKPADFWKLKDKENDNDGFK